jgi:prephenate dehydrogenase
MGLALRDRKLARRIVGIGRRQNSLDTARKIGAIDHGVTNLATGVSEAQFVIVATPVDLVVERVIQAVASAPPAALITDVGSTKEAIVSMVDSALATRRSGPRFVGSHPLAGDHRTGAEHARADMFDGRTVVVTPSEATRAAAVTEVSGFWQSLGAKVTTMSPAKHDAALAITSHLPHVAAVALAAATPTDLLALTASGWRDTTRVAGADPHLWQAIFTANRQHVLDAIDLLTQTLANFREALELGDHENLSAMLQASARKKKERDALGD